VADDTEFINRIIDEWQAGIDQEANFCRLFDRYYHSLYRFFEKRNFFAEECQDLIQETFFRVYIGLRTFRREAQFETWLFRIAFNTYQMTLQQQSAQKRAGRRVSWENTDEQAASGEGQPASLPLAREPLDQVLADERQRAVRQAIEALPEPLRKCLTLHVYQGLSHREIALAVRLPIGTVKTYISRARQQLKQTLADYFGEP